MSEEDNVAKLPINREVLCKLCGNVYTTGADEEHSNCAHCGGVNSHGVVSAQHQHLPNGGFTGIAIQKNGEAMELHPSVKHIMGFFRYAHLPPDLQKISKPVHDLAVEMVASGLQGAELTAGLRKLLEAKDCFVRAALPKEDGDV